MAKQEGWPPMQPGGEVVVQTVNGSAYPSGQRPTVAVTPEKSRAAPVVRGGSGNWNGNRTGE